MSASLVELDGEPFALLVESRDGHYLLPPIVLDEIGRVIEGQKVLDAMDLMGMTFEHPTIAGASPADLAEIDQTMARISDELGVPIRPTS